MVRRGDDAPAGLVGVRGVDDEHAAPEDRPVTERKDAEHRDDAAVPVPEGGTGRGASAEMAFGSAGMLTSGS